MILRALIISIFLTFYTFANAVRCYEAVTPSVGLRDSAVELEMALDEKVASFFTTENGRLMDLFNNVGEVPPRVNDWVKKSNKSIHEFILDELPLNLKAEALRLAIVASKMSFGSSVNGGREIKIFYVKPEYQKKYNLRKYIDLGAPKSIEDGNLIEFHMRSNLRPGDLVLKAKQFQTDLGYEPSPMHMHVVFDLPKLWLAESPTENAWKLFDFWRRLNLTMEMRDVFENGLSLIENYIDYQERRYSSFGVAKSKSHGIVLDYLISLGRAAHSNSSDKNIKSEAKIGWVGFWGHDKYDKPDLFGFEFRFLEGKDLPPNLVGFLNQIQEQVQNHNFGHQSSNLAAWSESIFFARTRVLNPVDYIKLMLSHHDYFPDNNYGLIDEVINPHRSYESLLNSRDYEFQRILLGMDKTRVSQAFNSKGRLRYLLHDWSMDPIVFNNPDLARKIRDLQLKALRKWSQGVDEKLLVQSFLLESGIYELFAESIGFKI
jgi:hypothetical protein